MEGEIMQNIAEREPLIRRALTVEDLFTKSEEERHYYELREKGRHDFDNAMITAEKRGMMREKLDLARNLLRMGMDADKTAQACGLSREEVERLRS
jgi:predicted transposase/invertase (TIGR01784 family)